MSYILVEFVLCTKLIANEGNRYLWGSIYHYNSILKIVPTVYTGTFRLYKDTNPLEKKSRIELYFTMYNSVYICPRKNILGYIWTLYYNTVTIL